MPRLRLRLNLFNEVLKNSGVRAEARTQIEFFDFQSTGVVSFDLEVANRVPIEISADVTPTNLSNLAIALNKVSTETGVVAVTSTDNTRIILTSDAGDDIAISKLGAASPAFLGRFVDDDGVAETSPIGTVSVTGALKHPWPRQAGYKCTNCGPNSINKFGEWIRC